MGGEADRSHAADGDQALEHAGIAGAGLVPRIADRDEMSRHAASVSGSGGMSGNEQVPGRAASRSSLPGKKLVFDNVGKIPIDKIGKVNDQDIFYGKAFQQAAYQDYLDK